MKFLCELVNVTIPAPFSRHRFGVPLHEVEVIKKAWPAKFLMEGKEVSFEETGRFEVVDSDEEAERLKGTWKHPELALVPFAMVYSEAPIVFEQALKINEIAAKEKQKRIAESKAKSEEQSLEAQAAARNAKQAVMPWPLEKMGPKTTEALAGMGIVSGEALFAVIGPDNENIGDREKLLEILRLPGITVKAVNGWRGQLLGV
jgi:hypothetical protein